MQFHDLGTGAVRIVQIQLPFGIPADLWSAILPGEPLLLPLTRIDRLHICYPE